MLPTLRLLSRSPFRLTMYTGTDCQLCDVMRHEITKASESVPIQLVTYNIRDDSLPDVHTWRRRYQYDIPVLHLGDKGGSHDGLGKWKMNSTADAKSPYGAVWNRNLSTQGDGRTADREASTS